MTVQTVHGHVAAALRFLETESLWMVLGHPFDWDVARLVGSEPAIGVTPVFTVVTAHTLTVNINGIEFSYLLAIGTYPVGTVVSGLSTAASAAGVAGSVTQTADNRVQFTAPIPDGGFGSVTIVAGSDVLGFATGDSSTATDGGIPPPNPATPYVVDPFAWAKVKEATMSPVVPDPDIGAVMIGSVRATLPGSTYDLTGTGDDQIAFKIDDFPTIIDVTLPAGTAVPLATIITFINAAGLAVSPDFGTVADIDASESPPALKLRSPTKGSLSKIEITTPNVALGFPPEDDPVVTGEDGGPIRFNTDHFRPVDIEDAYAEGARMVFIEAEFRYDQVPVKPWTQLGVVSSLAPVVGLEARTYLSFHEVLEFGIMEFLDHRALTPRSADQVEQIRLVLEF